MKRMWIGIGLLVAVLCTGILATNLMEKTHLPGAKDLDQAAQYVLEEDWAMAEALVSRAEKNWEKRRPVTAAFAEHEPLENIEGLFDQLKIYAAARDEVAYSGTCVYLARQLEALGESHSFTLWNLL